MICVRVHKTVIVFVMEYFKLTCVLKLTQSMTPVMNIQLQSEFLDQVSDVPWRLLNSLG